MMASKHVIELTDDTFDEVVLKSDVPVIVDFWAPLCRPCVAFAPEFEKIADSVAKETEKQAPGETVIRFAKLNVDDNPKSTELAKIMAIPTVCVFKKGKLTERAIGSSEALNMIERLLTSFSSSAFRS
jgi:thioredoxin 1